MTPLDLADLPHDPGCYLFRDVTGTILYIGKAKHLKHRVTSYFQKDHADPKTAQLVQKIVSVDVIVTNNEVEAFVLENNLIKYHQPRYNIDLKDAKNYAYIKLSDEDFPRIHIARRRHGGGSYFGPFVSARERDDVLNVLKRIFRLRTCRRLPKRACLRFYMQTCSAPCIGKISQGSYLEEVKRAEAILQGHASELMGPMRTEMAERSRMLDFERAKEIRDQISAIEKLRVRQHVERHMEYNEDVINYKRSDGDVTLMVFQVYRGRLADKEEFTFEFHEGFLEEFLVQYYSEKIPPSELILPEPVDESFLQFLTMIKGSLVHIAIPKRGEKKHLLDLVMKNIEVLHGRDQRKIDELQRILRLPEPPTVIECFDVSHFSGTAMVGSMVQFRSGRPDKMNYRRFRIKSVDSIDDVSAIGEVVRRRYTRLVRGRLELPDLIIIDGGKAQLHSAVKEMKQLGVSIPVIAIAKREEEVFVPGFSFPLPLSKRERSSLYIQEIRDEAHRFAHAYHKVLRRKAMIG